ncbi:MAG: TIGR03546 family protein [Treponemataceae bacterium]
MIQYVFSFFSSLNRNAHPGDIAHGVALGLILAILPKNNLLWPALFAFSIFVRMNKGAFFLSFIFFGFITPFWDVTIERLGFWVLSQPNMQSIYTTLDKIPFVGLTKFYNTMVAGGLLLGLILYVPVYIAVRLLVRLYRTKLQPKFAPLEDSKASGFLSKIPLLRHLGKIQEVKDLLDK